MRAQGLREAWEIARFQRGDDFLMFGLLDGEALFPAGIAGVGAGDDDSTESRDSASAGAAETTIDVGPNSNS